MARYQAAGYVFGNFVTQASAAQGGSVADPSGVGPTGPTVAPPTDTGSVTATSNPPSQFTSALNIVTMNAARPSYRPVGGSTLSAATSDDSLLLVDQALADFDADSSDDGDDYSLVACVRDDESESLSDMALAAVLEDQSNWWSGI